MDSLWWVNNKPEAQTLLVSDEQCEDLKLDIEYCIIKLYIADKHKIPHTSVEAMQGNFIYKAPFIHRGRFKVQEDNPGK